MSHNEKLQFGANLADQNVTAKNAKTINDGKQNNKKKRNKKKSLKLNLKILNLIPVWRLIGGTEIIVLNWACEINYVIWYLNYNFDKSYLIVQRNKKACRARTHVENIRIRDKGKKKGPKKVNLKE